MLYVIQQGEAGPVKIGYTQDPERLKRRLHSLQAGNPEELILRAASASGSMVAERKIHQALGRYRIRGEWFHFAAPLKTLIAHINADPERFDGIAWAKSYTGRSNAYAINRQNSRTRGRRIRPSA